jgi:rod shape-determining protein MreD
MNGTLLGEHALALTIVVYIVARMHSRLRMFPLMQQGLIIFLLELLYQFILYCIQGFIGEAPHGWLYWSPSITSMLLWPWVYSIMRDCRRRFKVA